MLKHNKKRNTGLLYEFLVRKVSKSLIEHKDKERDTALSVIRKHFKKNSELLREFRLFHSLIATTVKSGTVADSIIESAKQASKKLDHEKLDHEKSLLIKSINYKINESNFYDQRIPDYKIYATIQTLLNEWREDSYSDIVGMAQHEEILRQWLLSDKKVVSITEDDLKEADPLVEKLMVKKLNEKYSGRLSEEQASLIKDYIFSGKNSGELGSKLEKIKEETLGRIEEYLSESKDPYLGEKLKKVKNIILSENLDVIDEEKMTRFLDVVQLNEDLRGGKINA